MGVSRGAASAAHEIARRAFPGVVTDGRPRAHVHRGIRMTVQRWSNGAYTVQPDRPGDREREAACEVWDVLNDAHGLRGIARARAAHEVGL